MPDLPHWPDQPAFIVDDDEHFLRLMQRALLGLGWQQVRELTDPRAVVPLARTFRPGVIILDLIMDERDGFDVLDELIEALPNIPVLICSGIDDADHACRCLRRGAVDYITKPPDRPQLLAGLQRAMERTRQWRMGGVSDTRLDPGEALQLMHPLPDLKTMPDLLIEEALRRSSGVLKNAAAMIGISPQAICNRRRRLEEKR